MNEKPVYRPHWALIVASALIWTAIGCIIAFVFVSS